jgi:23S rRNA (cytidine2498-2'-O)-methyltransferase
MPFLFTVCHVGAEPAVKREFARLHPNLRFAYSRPGFVTFKSTAALAADFSPGAVFARAWGVSEGPTDDAKVIARARALGKPRLHVFSRFPDVQPDPAIRDRLLASGAFLADERAKPGDAVVDVIVDGPQKVEDGGAKRVVADPPWLGHHTHRAGRSPWAGGRFPVEVPEDAPARAFRKLEEALAWSGAPVAAGDVAIDLRAAPGGATYALLRRGLRVIAVDPRPLSKVLAPFSAVDGRSVPRLTHLAMPIGEVRRDALPERVQWVVWDANIAPRLALQALERLIKPLRRSLKGVLLTLKMDDDGVIDALPQILGVVRELGFDARATQLPGGRGEVFCYARTNRAQD